MHPGAPCSNLILELIQKPHSGISLAETFILQRAIDYGMHSSEIERRVAYFIKLRYSGWQPNLFFKTGKSLIANV